MKTTTALLLFAFGALGLKDVDGAKSQASSPADPGWPRQAKNEQGSLVYYQPQVDDWKDFKELDFRAAFALTPKGQKEIIGVVTLHAHTDVNVDNRDVVLTDFKITDVHVPSLAPDQAAKVDQVVRSFLPPNHTVSISLDRLVASVDQSKAPAPVQVQNDPPPIFVSYSPAILLQIDGEPIRTDIAGTNLGFAVNSNFPVFFEKEGDKLYYLYTGQQWLKAAGFEGPWAAAPSLPKDMSKVARDPQWAQMKKAILSPAAQGKPPTVFYSNKPAEVILFKGQPAYAAIPGTQLSYATNTDCDLFTYGPTKEYYYLMAGRWFKATDLKGPWSYVTPGLPPDFANIPQNTPAGRVLVSVPGTAEAKDAVLLAQVPTSAIIDPKAAEQVKVSYNGDPEFKPIEGTSLQYATNTAEKVIKAGEVYYLCLQGVWFTSSAPQGPWAAADSVPPEIYQIPPSSPVYNVTYVTQTKNSEGKIQASYTAGYLGTFITGAAVGAIVASGTGYYYPPYIRVGYGYPYYYPYVATYGVGSYYNPYTGAYGIARGVYGPYYGAAAGSYYNPYTGTYARGATAYGPYGTRSVGQAYNPYTGTYAATRQGSNAYSSWGQSYISNGDRSATTQHYSNANGTAASIHGSQGGEAAGVSTKNGNTAAGKTSNGDMYADHNGNVYKNTGSGWEKYDNGSWNPVQKPDNVKNENNANRTSDAAGNKTTDQQLGQSSQRSNTSGTRENGQNSSRSSAKSTSRASSSGASDVDRDFQSRQRGGSQSQRFSNFQRSGGSDRSSGTRRAGGDRRR